MPFPLRTILLGSATVHREQLSWRRPVQSAVVTTALTAVCIAIDEPQFALAIAIGAWFAGIADTGEVIGDHWRSMAWTTLWVSVAALVGALASEHNVAEVAVVALMALACGYVGALGPRGAVNGMLALVVYAIFAGSPTSDRGAVQMFALVAVGGTVQILVTVLPALLRKVGTLASAVDHRDPVWGRLRLHLRPDDDFARHAARLAIAMVIASVIANISGWPHEYWIPMSVAWMARPDKYGTATRVVERILGTIAGIVIAAIIVDGMELGPYGLVVLVGVGVFLCLAFLRANYPVAVIGITCAVVALFALQGETVAETAPTRIAATLIAGVITVLTSFIWPSKDQPAN